MSSKPISNQKADTPSLSNPAHSACVDQQDIPADMASLFKSFGPDADQNITSILEFALGVVQGQFAVYHHFDTKRHQIITRQAFTVPKNFRPNGRLRGRICYEAFVTAKQPHLFINDLRHSPYWDSDPDVERYGLKAYIGCPVSLQGRVWGSLDIYDRHTGAYDWHHIRMMALLADIIAFIEQRRLHEQDFKCKLHREKMLADISAIAISDHEMHQFLAHSLEIIGMAMDADGVALFAKETEEHIPKKVAHWRAATCKQFETRSAISDLASLDIVRDVVRKGRMIHWDDVQTLSNQGARRLLKRHHIHRLLLLPLLHQSKPHGFCCLFWQKGSHPMREEDIVKLNAAMRILTQRLTRHFMANRLDESEALVNQLFQLAPAAIYRIDLRNQRILATNDYLCRASGYTKEELLALNPQEILTPKSRQKYLKRMKDIAAGKPVSETAEFEVVTKSGEVEWGRFHIRHMHENNQIVGAHVVAHFITEQKKAREAIKDYQKNLESKVSARTAELAEANQALRKEIEQRVQTADKLKASSERLKEMNTAMRVLLDKRMEDHQRTEELIRLNLKELIDPYLTRLEDGELRGSQRQLVDLIRVNLDEVVGASMPELSSKYYIFSPNELQVVNLIRKGKTTKEIARLLNLSTRTVESYRNSIRKKLELKNKKVNLRTYLSSI